LASGYCLITKNQKLKIIDLTEVYKYYKVIIF